jgi:hypothetical protein
LEFRLQAVEVRPPEGRTPNDFLMRLNMKTRNRSIIEQFIRTLAEAGVCVLLLSFGATAFAQGSVEKGETSQQARAPESELERARAIVTKPGENKPDKPETGRTWSVYSMTTTFEIGHRFVDTDGSLDRYLSDVNVRDGFRLLEYSTDMRAKPGAGLLFDFLKADVSNAGGDQSQTFSLRMDKTRAYRFDGNVRRFNYYRSPGPNFALGLRDYDLRQQVSDFNLKLSRSAPSASTPVMDAVWPRAVTIRPTATNATCSNSTARRGGRRTITGSGWTRVITSGISASNNSTATSATTRRSLPRQASTWAST